jgi:hypothetical protein
LQLPVRRTQLRDQFAAHRREYILSRSVQHVVITAGLQHDKQKEIDINVGPVAAI